MGIQFIEMIVQIWNRIIGRKKNDTKKRNKQKGATRKYTHRNKSRKKAEAGCRDRIFSETPVTEEKS